MLSSKNIQVVAAPVEAAPAAPTVVTVKLASYPADKKVGVIKAVKSILGANDPGFNLVKVCYLMIIFKNSI